uniref:Uncharacterized protein n=1 Tax=Oryza punctata TaxID=4537 RepID=A0A0E0KIN4_ORYPU
MCHLSPPPPPRPRNMAEETGNDNQVVQGNEIVPSNEEAQAEEVQGDELVPAEDLTQATPEAPSTALVKALGLACRSAMQVGHLWLGGVPISRRLTRGSRLAGMAGRREPTEMAQVLEGIDATSFFDFSEKMTVRCNG